MKRQTWPWVRKAEEDVQAAREYREQIHAVLLALVTGGGELGIVPRRRIDEPTPAGGVVVEPDGAAGGEAGPVRDLLGGKDLTGRLDLVSSP